MRGILKSNLEGDVENRRVRVPQEEDGAVEPGPHHVLVGAAPRHLFEQPREMKRADPRNVGQRKQLETLREVSLDVSAGARHRFGGSAFPRRALSRPALMKPLRAHHLDEHAAAEIVHL